MKKANYPVLFKVMFVIILLITIYSCKDDTVTPAGTKSISGTITFADTIFQTINGYYDVSVFPRSGWPPMAGPINNDSLIITKVGNKYQANYMLTDLPDGEYVLTSAWIKLPYNPATSTIGLGLYGCDTSHSASCLFGTPGTVTISDGQGKENINFLSWADTLKRIY